MIASQFPALAVSFIASNRLQQNAEQSECHASAITALINRLSQSDSSSAFDALVRCGGSAVRPLIATLNDRRQNSLTRRLVARALSQIGSPEAIAALLSIAQQPSEIQDSAVRAIKDINPQAREAVPVLLTTTISQNAEVMTARADALQRIDPAVPVRAIVTAFWEAASSPNADGYRTSTALLAQLRTSNANLADLTQALQNRNAVIRAIAAYLLLQEGRNAQPTIPQLTAALRDESPLVRDTAACALGRIGTREAITILITQLRAGNEATQASAAIGLSSLTAEAREALPVLIAALRDDNEQVRSMAAYGLGQMERDARRAIPALIGRVSDRSASVRGAAIHALGRIAPDEPRVIRAVIRQSALERDLTVMGNAVETLQQLPPDALPTLLEIIAFDENRRNVAITDARVNLFDFQTLPQLTEEESLRLIPLVLRQYSEFPNAERASTIAYLRRQLTPQIISRLVAILEDENQDIRLRGNAAMAVGAADLESPLIAILEDENQDRALRTDAASALGFTQGSSAATASLIQFIRSSRAYQAGLNLSSAESEEYLSSEVLSSEFNLISSAFISLLAFNNQAEVDLFLIQFEQENPTLFDVMLGLVSAGLADGPEMVRLLQERSQAPAICRVSFIQRFLWRCR